MYYIYNSHMFFDYQKYVFSGRKKYKQVSIRVWAMVINFSWTIKC